MTRAGTRDSGNYTCLPSRGEAVSADVHVITGEECFLWIGVQGGHIVAHCHIYVALVAVHVGLGYGKA